MGKSPGLFEAARAIARRDPEAARTVRANLALASATFSKGATRSNPTDWYLKELEHYIYEGDTLLHIAAATYDSELARVLIGGGAKVQARNRRGATPLHYAVDGGPDLSTWDPRSQGRVIQYLIKAGADPNAPDKGGVLPLHRAVRNRCAHAVEALLAGGADPRILNKKGSSPMQLAQISTGRGGSGSPAAKKQQAEIVRMLARTHGSSGKVVVRTRRSRRTSASA